jgi:hypothetical protein
LADILRIFCSGGREDGCQDDEYDYHVPAEEIELSNVRTRRDNGFEGYTKYYFLLTGFTLEPLRASCHVLRSIGRIENPRRRAVGTVRVVSRPTDVPKRRSK